MVVCHCESVNDRRIRSMAQAGVGAGEITVDDVVDQCGAGGQCGGCRESIERLLAAVRAETVSSAAGGCPVAVGAVR